MNTGKIPAIVALLLSFLILPNSVQAYSGGSGTAGDPYKIGSPADLLALAADTNNYNKHFILTADINLAASGTFTTAVIAPDTSNLAGGFQGVAFTGVFDGNNHTISNLTIDTGGAGNDYLGLFGSASSGEIKNLGLENVSITGGDDSYYLGGLAGYNTDSISVCYSTGAVTGGSNSFDLGGLVGTNSGNISNCHSTGAVIGGDDSVYLGGLVGDNYGSISNCYSTGTVTGGDRAYSLGGLVGRNSNGGTTSKCYSTDAVSGGDVSSVLGGLVGFNYSNISDCYSTGAVTGTYYPGGLVGYNQNGSISNSYSTGHVSGTSSFGGLVGYNTGGTISNCYFLNTEHNNGLGTQLTDTQMKHQASFIGWDFVYTWRIREGVSSPKLPYRIGTVGSLLAIAANTADYDEYFVLTADINLAGAGPFTTAVIAPDTNNSNENFDGNAFTGIFDGNGHTISNLTIDTGGAGNDYLGLFGKTGSGGQIKNLGLKNVSITGGDNSVFLGALAGWSAGGSSIGYCHSTGTVSGGATSKHLGGLAGDNDGAISDCFSTAAVNSGGNSEDLGGLVGLGGGTISNSYSKGDVSGGDSSKYLGGLIGRNWGAGATISRCYSTSTIKGGDGSQYLGGLIGFDNAGGVSNCYSTGDVTGESSSQYLGGMMGENFSATISNCYSIGDVTGGSGSSNLGGLAGTNVGGTFTHCYFLTGSGPDNGIGTSLSSSNMKKQASFSGWNFVNTWRILEDVSYPKLHVSDYSGGSGTSGEPYKIATVADLLAMAANTADYDAYFIFMADIDLASYSFNTAVIAPDTINSDFSFSGDAFTGVFDGNEHRISNLTIDTSGAGNEYLGLFGSVDPGGEIKNLGLKNVSITSGAASYSIGALAGYTAGNVSDSFSTGNVTLGNSCDVGGLVGASNGNISRCRSACSISVEDNSTYLGGLVGFAGNGTVSNCFSTGGVTGGNNAESLGGLIGFNNTLSTVSSCSSASAVTGGEDSRLLGGLVGFNDGDIYSSCSTGPAAGGGDYSQSLGGLVGYNNAGISNCYAIGSVTNAYYIGGLVGRNKGGIDKCYSAGLVTVVVGSSDFDGLAGENDGDINDCYFLITSGPNDISGAARLTDKQMKQQKSFVGFDFVAGDADGTDDIWWINKGVSYPKLTWQVDVTKCTVTAGSKPSTDKISLSGNMGASDDDFSDPNSPIVKVTVDSKYLVNPCVHTFPVDANTFKKGKYNYSKTIGGVKKSFTYDTKTHKFSFSAGNIDLSGFDCPATLLIEVGDYFGPVQMNETLVNGKMPVPIQLMTEVRNVLRVDKCTVKQNNKKANSDQLSVSGAFAVEDPNVSMADRISAGLLITLDTQTFTIPAGLKAGTGKFSCTKANVTEGGIAAATFDFNKCSFTLIIKNTNIPTGLGDVDFGVSFAGFNESDEVALP